MNRLPPVVLTAALLLTACSTQGSPPASEVTPRPTASASSLLAPKPTATSRPSRPPARSAPQAPVRDVPLTKTDPAQARPDQATVPVRLEVPKLDIYMDVVAVGVDDRGDMELPDRVSRAGWYEFGPRPSDSAGATVLAAHVDSVKDGLGPFARLRSVRKGTPVELTTQDGRTHRYRVTSVDVVSKSTVPLAEVFDRSGEPRLTLITCGGAYDRGTGYSDNVVVTALPETSVTS